MDHLFHVALYWDDMELMDETDGVLARRRVLYRNI